MKVCHRVLTSRHAVEACLKAVPCLKVPEKHPVLEQKERVVVPAVTPERVKHVRPHRLVVLLVLVQPVLADLQKESYALHIDTSLFSRVV